MKLNPPDCILIEFRFKEILEGVAYHRIGGLKSLQNSTKSPTSSDPKIKDENNSQNKPENVKY